VSFTARRYVVVAVLASVLGGGCASRAIRGRAVPGDVTPDSRAPARAVPAVAAVVRGHIPELEYCYNAALGRSRELRGTVTLAALVDGAGRVTRVTIVERSWGIGQVATSAEDCLREQVRTWLFPASSAGTYRFPVRFARR